MTRKILCIIILNFLLLHSSRSGLINILIQNRHEIAHTLGMMAEVPIAICSSDYDFDTAVKFEDSPGDAMPTPSFLQALEITLFLPIGPMELTNQSYEIRGSTIPSYMARYSSPRLGIFQPPKS